MSGSQPLTDAVEELQQQLQAARDELQAFTYAVSHDLRAPLRHINAFAQIIEEDWPDLPAEVAGHLATIRQSAQLLTRQLDGLTALSRVAQQPLEIKPVNVAAVLADAIAARAQEVRLPPVDWQIAESLPLLWADAAMLRQVLDRVLDNAIKFTHTRNRALIRVDGEQQPDGSASLAIADNGVGFPPEQGSQLFKPFARLHSAREFEGLGLGLVMSRKRMARMGARMDITAEPDRGCTVRLVFPAPPALPSPHGKVL